MRFRIYKQILYISILSLVYYTTKILHTLDVSLDLLRRLSMSKQYLKKFNKRVITALVTPLTKDLSKSMK